MSSAAASFSEAHASAGSGDTCRPDRSFFTLSVSSAVTTRFIPVMKRLDKALFAELYAFPISLILPTVLPAPMNQVCSASFSTHSFRHRISSFCVSDTSSSEFAVPIMANPFSFRSKKIHPGICSGIAASSVRSCSEGIAFSFPRTVIRMTE